MKKHEKVDLQGTLGAIDHVHTTKSTSQVKSVLRLSQDTQNFMAFLLEQKYKYYILTCQLMPHLEEGQTCTCLHFL